MRVVIVSGGRAPSENILKRYTDEKSYIICADSGANCLYKYGIVPNIVLGDFDSINKEVLSYFINKKCKIAEYQAEKDFTDTEAAFNEALKCEPSEIIFLGCTGSRLDHALANLGLLNRCLSLNIKASIVDENNRITLHNKSFEVEGNLGETFSLQCFGETVKNLSILGAKYPLYNYDLSFGDPRTVSNEFLNGKASIQFDSGIIMLLRVND